MQFDLDRNVDAAARDVQAAINSARGQLPANLPTNPTWRKVNPAESDFMNLAVTVGHGHDAATLRRGGVHPGAEALPDPGHGASERWREFAAGVRVEVNPLLLSKLGLGWTRCALALGAANADAPKGALADGKRMYVVNDNDQLFLAKEYAPLIVAYRNGAAGQAVRRGHGGR